MKCPTCECRISWVSLREVDYHDDGCAYTPCPECKTLVKCLNFPRKKINDENNAD